MVAAVFGVGFGAASWYMSGRFLADYDFAVFQRAARAVLALENPYATVLGELPGVHGVPVFFSPMPMALVVLPLVAVPLRVACALFVGVSASVLAFASITARGPWGLFVFANAAFLIGASAGQVAPLVTAGAFLPSLAWLGVFKPNLGLAMLAQFRSWRALATTTAIMLAIGAVSLVVRPSWPLDWIRNAAGSRYHVAMIRAPGGFILLLALLRWRRPEARLLLTLALVPTTPAAYDVLPLFAIPETRNEMLVLCLVSFAAQACVRGSLLVPHERAAYFASAVPAFLWLVYVPALIMVLRRPNTYGS
jgi:hypothetical protein